MSTVVYRYPTVPILKLPNFLFGLIRQYDTVPKYISCIGTGLVPVPVFPTQYWKFYKKFWYWEPVTVLNLCGTNLFLIPSFNEKLHLHVCEPVTFENLNHKFMTNLPRELNKFVFPQIAATWMDLLYSTWIKIKL